MANKHMRKKKTASLIKGGGIQIKTTTRYHLTCIRISNIKKKKKDKVSVGQVGEKAEPLGTVGGNVKWCSHYRK